ncbi:60S ribosomal protein L31, putative [Entamoeba invadens IP1]|uniref:60S ribosomal protein L31, putative n=1 Tax=Entamoeba invadens IP1 TaxID=370355 RepID=UPI0002C3FA31|nr:60S ribosomal protein L31, putative [Entamoeba invadens IP1]ELP90432.1 60S ribosomal protein L31, putative [Entamoeba invadens IP1]|eukprot:XP_004257203.1 60S ribosomal protein L31, putative [Entamoeba invadens IP1]
MAGKERKVTNPRLLKYQKVNQARRDAKKAKKAAATKPVKKAVKELAPLTKEMTLYMHRFMHKEGFKHRAPKAIKVIRFIAMKTMKTHRIKFDMGLNQYVWSMGIRNVAHRIRVRMARMPLEGEEGKFYTLVSYVPVASFKGLLTKTVEAEN